MRNYNVILYVNTEMEDEKNIIKDVFDLTHTSTISAYQILN